MTWGESSMDQPMYEGSMPRIKPSNFCIYPVKAMTLKMSNPCMEAKELFC